MRKFLAVAKREYFKVVWAKAFILSTLLAPVFITLKGNILNLTYSEGLLNPSDLG